MAFLLGFQRGAGRASGDLKVQRILKHLTEPTGERQHPFGNTTLPTKSSVLPPWFRLMRKRGCEQMRQAPVLRQKDALMAWQLTVFAHPAQTCGGTNGVRSPVLPQQRFSLCPPPCSSPSIAQTKGFRTSEQTPFDIEMRFTMNKTAFLPLQYGHQPGGKPGSRIGTTLAIDCIAVEDEYGNTPAQRAELDWLLYNKPLEYAQMVLRGGWSVIFLSAVTTAGWRIEPQKTRGKIANRAARVSARDFTFPKFNRITVLFLQILTFTSHLPRMKNARPCDFSSQLIRGQLDLFALCSCDCAFFSVKFSANHAKSAYFQRKIPESQRK